MSRRATHRHLERGWTIIEFIIVIAVMSILSAIGTAGYETLQARVRYSQVRAALDIISRAAYEDFTSDLNNEWADFVIPGDPPDFVGPSGTLTTWPIAPCPNWVYSWDNLYGVPGVNAVRVSLRRAFDGPALYSFCLENYGGSCQGVDPIGGGAPPEISSVPNKHFYCNE